MSNHNYRATSRIGPPGDMAGMAPLKINDLCIVLTQNNLPRPVEHRPVEHLPLPTARRISDAAHEHGSYPAMITLNKIAP